MKTEKENFSSPHLKSLQKDLEKIQKSVGYLEKERTKLMKDKEIVMSKIRKEKKILGLKKQIEKVKGK